jgi:hypothetical protein
MRKLIFAGLAAATLMGAAGVSSAQPVVVERYGHWDPTWGVAPPAPMHSWRRWRGHENGWYSHVHNCMVRYHGYDARRDMYREGRRWVACAD